MIINDVRVKDIQIALKMNNNVMVCETLAGKKNNTAVLTFLMKKGCPEENLALPERMKGSL